MATESSKVTIGTIAKLAGVSVMTVSRILNDKPDVSAATRERVWNVIREQHYQPHRLAQKLSGKQSRIIGLALYSRGHPFSGMYLEVLQGVQSALAIEGYDIMLLAPSASDHYGYRVAQTSLIDGVVLMGLLAEEEDMHLFQQGATPFITIGRRQVGEVTPPFIAPDYRQAFHDAVEYVVRQHCTRLTVFVASLQHAKDFPSVSERLEGIHDGVVATGIDSAGVVLVESGQGFQAGYRYGLHMPLAESLILDSTDFSFGVAVALAERGVQSSKDLLVLGMDYDQGIIQRCANVLGTKIPAWSVSWNQIGREAALALLTQINTPTSPAIRQYEAFSFRLIDRW